MMESILERSGAKESVRKDEDNTSDLSQYDQEDCLTQNEEHICRICQEKLNSEELLSNHYQGHIAVLP